MASSRVIARTAPLDAVSSISTSHTYKSGDSLQASCGVAAPSLATKEATLMILPPRCNPFSESTLFYESALLKGVQLLTYVSHSDNGVLTPEPNTFNIDSLGQVPDPLFGVDSIVVPACQPPFLNSKVRPTARA